jgi:hypothetical protein
MAEKKAPAKSSAAKGTPATGSDPQGKSPSPAASVTAAADPAPPKGRTRAAKAPDTAPISKRGVCTAEKCGRPLRAKGYCRKHFLAWRRGKIGTHHRYKICTKEACRKQRAFGSLCAEHAGKADAVTPGTGAAAPS